MSCAQEITKAQHNMHEWLSGRASPCQGEGRGFESRLALRTNPVKSRLSEFRKVLFFCQSENVKVFVKVLDFSMMLFMQGFYPHRH